MERAGVQSDCLATLRLPLTFWEPPSRESRPDTWVCPRVWGETEPGNSYKAGPCREGVHPGEDFVVTLRGREGEKVYSGIYGFAAELWNFAAPHQLAR